MNKENKKLGMGLGALLSTSSDSKSNVNKIDISKIYPNKQQPRKNFEERDIQELSNSIKSQGLIQPIIVRDDGDENYEIIAGERRWRACQLAGLHSVDCVVMSASEEKVFELAINAGAKECSQMNNIHEIITNKEDFYKVKTELEKNIDNFFYSGIEWRASSYQNLNKEQSKKVVEVLSSLEEIDDVQNVFTNANIEI